MVQMIQMTFFVQRSALDTSLARAMSDNRIQAVLGEVYLSLVGSGRGGLVLWLDAMTQADSPRDPP